MIAGEREGLAIYKIRPDPLSAELVTLDAFKPHQGIGGALIETLVARMRQQGVQLLRVTTTNDNLDALRFYQRRGFRIVALRPGPVDESRKIKSTIPVLGEYGIPIRDEIELELLIERRSQESESRSR